MPEHASPTAIDVPPIPCEHRADEGPVKVAAAMFLDALRSGGSVLCERDVWTEANIETLVERFVNQPDVSGSSFPAKLDKQLAGTGDDVRILFAEIYLLQMLPIMQVSKQKKLANIESVLRDVEVDHRVPAEVDDALDHPIFNGGVAFTIRRFQQLSVLIEFARHLRALPADEVDAAFADPLLWRARVHGSPGAAEPSLRACLTYLGHPDYFMSIVSVGQKRAIVESFFPSVTGRAPSDDVDVDLAALRFWLQSEPGDTPDYYAEPLKSYWQPDDEEVDGDVDTAGPVVDGDYTVESIIADGAFHSPEELRKIVQRWGETRNIVLQGAPGTGKTWLARRLAYALIGSRLDDAVRSVQFHPGTSYEDFVRGWRPGGDGRLTLVDGPLLQHAARARTAPDIPHVIVIEEFNRGNPAQALGEMLTLLERSKRTAADALELTYMRDDELAFFLPDNLYVVGTMNTADRSLALVDFALRRRFAFFELEPQFTDAWAAELAGRFRSDAPTRIDGLRTRIVAMNQRIADDPSLGPSFRIGHAYFTPGLEAPDLATWFTSVVESSVRPQLAEYWHDDPATVDDVVADLMSGL